MKPNHKNKTVKHILSNGLKVLFRSFDGAPSITFMVWYKTGSKNETEKKTGLAHFLEHLSFKQTHFFSKGQIVAEITRNGGNFNAYTSRDFTAYYETFATSKLELAMLIESERMNNLIIEEEDREKEVGIILSELEKNLDNPYNSLEVALRKRAYSASHPYAHPIIGYSKDIESIELSDLKRYYDRYYSPNNATIVVVGNFDQNQTLDLIKKYFEPVKPKEIPANPYMYKFQNKQIQPKRVTVKKAGSSSIIQLAYLIPPANNKDIFPLIVLGEMLNLGISSRIYQSLVETQIATDITVNVEVAKETGLFTIQATLFPNISHQKAEKNILNQIKSLINENPPSDEELEKTKRRIKSSFEFNRDGTFKFAYILGYYDAVDSYKFVDNYIDNIMKVSNREVIDVISKYLIPTNVTIGNFIPSHKEENKVIDNDFDYIPQEAIHHIYKSSPIIFEEKISTSPITFSKKILDNGVKILFTENKTSETIKLYGTIGAGNLYCATVNPALPVMCAGMLNRGSLNRPKIQIANEVESRGASVGVSNVGEAVNFSLSSTSDDFSYILSILADILMSPSFPEDEYEKYKRFSIAGVRQKQENTAYLASLAFSQMVYPRNHIFYTHSLSSQEKHLKQLTLNDLVHFYENYYSPHNLILGISGNISADKVFNLIEQYFGGWKKKEVPEPIIKPAKLQKILKEKTVNVAEKVEAEVIFGHYGNLERNNKDFHKAMVMNFILGGSGALSSRIGKKLREDLGLVYSINSSFASLLISGAWFARFGVDEHYADLSINVLKQEIENFIEKGITDDELNLAKSYLIGSYPLRFTNNTGIARALLANEFYDLGEDYLNEYPHIISRITKEEINLTAKKYIHPEVATIIKAGSFS